MELLSPGTWVRVGDDELVAFVSAVTIRAAQHVTYEVTYWHGPERRCVWVEPRELRPMPSQPTPIRMGFPVKLHEGDAA